MEASADVPSPEDIDDESEDEEEFDFFEYWAPFGEHLKELFDKEWEIRAMTVAEPRRKMQMAVDNVFDELRESKDDARESAEEALEWIAEFDKQVEAIQRKVDHFSNLIFHLQSWRGAYKYDKEREEWLERNLSTKASHALRWSEDLTAELKQADRYRKVVQSLTSAGRPDEERVALLYFFCWSYATTEKPCCPLGCGDRCTCGYVGVFV